MKTKATVRAAGWIFVTLAAFAFGELLLAPLACAQGSRRDDIVFGPSGHPIAGATITVCQSTATGSPCSPLATIYTDATLTVPAMNPFQGDGIGNFHFYAPAGRYLVQVTGPNITGTITYPDVILPADLSSTAAGNNISAFGLTLGGNLSVSGNATITGTLTTTNFNPGTFSPSSLAVPGNISAAGPRPWVDVTAPPYNAAGNGTTDDTAAIQASINAACATGGSVFFPATLSTGSGYYKLSQPQTPSTSPVLTIPCNNMHLLGGNSSASQHSNAANPSAPAVSLVVASTGSSPNAAPVFGLGWGATTSALTSLSGSGSVITFTCAQTPCFPDTAVTVTTVAVFGTSNSAFNGRLFTVNSGYSGNTFTANSSISGTATGGSVGTYASDGTTFENLSISGYNQAVGAWASNHLRFRNVQLGAGITSLANNTPLKITNMFEVYYEGGGLNAQTGTPAAIFTADASVIGEGQTVGILHMSDMIITTGLGISYVQRAGNNGPITGDWYFSNIVQEGATNSFLTFTNTSGSAMQVAAFHFDHVQMADCGNGAGCPTPGNLIFFAGASGDILSGVRIEQSVAALGGVPAIKMASGTTLLEYQTDACITNCAQAVVDTNGNVVGNGQIQDVGGGTDFISKNNAPISTAFLAASNGLTAGAGARYFKNGTLAANLGTDAFSGVMFNDGASYGFNSSIYQNALETIDLQFAKLLPPTAVGGAAASGGTIPNGTYYVWVSSTADNCTGTQSASSIPSSAVVLSGSNGTIVASWALPVASYSAPAGYCVAISQSIIAPPASGTTFVSGASTTSYSVTSASTFALSMLAYNNFQPTHRFTVNSLGVNTTSPQYNLDVNGAAAVNSLNGVQKAERFAGSDAGVQLNACLTAASTTSGVCDARGLTGTYTAAAHITIPKGTTLAWCQGKLTVNDSTTKDAVELGGDGASLYGCQESGLGTVPRPQTSGYIACGVAGCTTVDNPNSATANIDWVHINGMYLQASGASSIVMNMTSIGHADIENNYLVLGTGGNSYGIYGNTSTGNLDSTNSLIKHNDISPESSGDDCAYMAGVFNVIVFELNTCYLPPAASQGFVLAKDTNGNYPDNDEFYGNDCETSSQAFNQICFNIVGAQSVVIGPNNRCENTYNCFQWPSDGSAVGIHLLDPYLSPSVNTVVKPNEPAAAQIAVDNNGHNWLPSMHFGMNDLAGPNLLGNAAFEGWQNTTTLFYWGGASGTNINQAGSGIYLQNLASSSTPAVDPNTQGNYNLRVGDGATAGLGVNSGCVQVDATTEYTLMFRVASGSTSNNFRPGFRFYSDANCTEADKITSASSNARILSPANYNGTSTTTANWQSTNASLTYNNGITCNCNVTGADWQVSTASTWTATRNFGITFRVPNAYGSSSTVTHSMRVFLLENTAAAGNYIYFDDIVLSQGPVTQDFRARYVPDSGNPAVYGSLAISQHLNQGAANTFAGSVALAAGTATVTFPTAFNSAPVCTANDTSAIATVRVQTTATTITLTQSSGTDTIMYICIGNPN